MSSHAVLGGLRGGISIALALSLPEVAEKPALLAATYAVVVFTVVVPGLTLRALVPGWSKLGKVLAL